MAERRPADRLERLFHGSLNRAAGREVGRGLADGVGCLGKRRRRRQQLGERAVEDLPDQPAMNGAGPRDPESRAPVRAALDGEMVGVAENRRVEVAAAVAAVVGRLGELPAPEGEPRVVPGPAVGGEGELDPEGVGAANALTRV